MTGIARAHVGPRMSQVVTHGGLVYLAGQVAEEAEGRSVADQATQVLAKIDRYLAEAGSDRSRILQATIWLADLAAYGEFNAVWDAWIDPQNPPARACLEARLVHASWSVEIMLIAAQ